MSFSGQQEWATWGRAAGALAESAERLRKGGGEAESVARLARQARVTAAITLTGLARGVARVTQ